MLGFPVAQWIKNPLEMEEIQEMQLRSLGWKDPLEEGMTSLCSVLAWKPHGERSLVGYRP